MNELEVAREDLALREDHREETQQPERERVGVIITAKTTETRSLSIASFFKSVRKQNSKACSWVEGGRYAPCSLRYAHCITVCVCVYSIFVSKCVVQTICIH